MKNWLRRLLPVAVVLLVVGAIVYGFWPRPVEVDLGTVTRGPMRVTVDEEGKTRIRDVYVIDAPLGGSLHRVRLKAGSPVVEGETVLAVIEPGDPAFLSATELAQAQSRVRVAEAAQKAAADRAGAAKKEHDLAVANHARIRKSHEAGVASGEELQTAEIREQVRAAEVQAALSAARVAESEVELARAALVRSNPKSALPPEDARLVIRARTNGVVLKVDRESAGAIATGTPIMSVGNPADLEMVIDVLSTDAVKITPGNRVIVERWGGGEPLAGRVRLVEPAAVLKVSALGVEEQRVNVIADFADPPEKRKGLGHAYRIDAKIVVWEASEAVKVPAGALFRGTDGEWAVFAVRDGVARATPVRVGHSNGVDAEVLEGLAPGDRVVMHPSDRVTDGVEVVGR
jgi:HlyD family secretion protein